MSLRLPGRNDALWESQHSVVGSGLIVPTPAGIRIGHKCCSKQIYSNAQFDDYQLLPRRRYPWSAPLRLEIRARFSHGAEHLVGTAGFGFWNDPFMFLGARTPSLPRAIWFFFSSQPSDMALARNVSGCGWKAATIDAQRAQFYMLAPTAPIAIPLMNIEYIYRRLWPIAQRAIGVTEAEIKADMTGWHTYVLAWNEQSVEFYVDGACVLVTDQSPNGRLGLVVWMDNQYLVVTPQGKLRHGLLSTTRCQWMEVGHIDVHRLQEFPAPVDTE
jgi:hypothetical protein